VLTVILQNQEGLDLPADVVLRETCFFLLASAHTSATAFTRTLHNLFGWLAEHPEGAARARSDQRFVQRAVHETVRLSPSSPVAMRWALEDIDLPGDLHIPVGSKVVVDLLAVNQDPTVWGIDATRFDPDRVAPEGRSPWGLSFGSGMHACIGQDLAGGLLPVPGRAEEEDLYGLVPVVVQWMLDHGARPDPDDPPEIDPTTARQYWKRYPARFGA
jgi:cytochrome P450